MWIMSESPIRFMDSILARRSRAWRQPGLSSFAEVLGKEGLGAGCPPGDEEAIHLFLKSALAQAILIAHWNTGRIYYATEAAATLLGVAPDLMCGMSALQFFVDSNQRLDSMRRLGLGEKVIHTELRLRSFDGRDLCVLANLGRITYRGERSLILVLNDMTDYKCHEHRLLDSRHRLRAQARQMARENDSWRERHEAAKAESEAKSRFLARMSHEMRSPLNAILGFAEIIRDGTLGEMGRHKRAEYAGHIHCAGLHLLGVINDVLDLSKIEAGKMELDLEAVDLAALCEECLALMGPEASRREVALSLRRSEAPLPPALADRQRCRQILINLLSNALKFTRAGGQAWIELDRDREGRIALIVADSGIGMSPAEMAIALEPFGQVPGASVSEGGGTGLGLPIVCSLVEAQGGQFRIASHPGRGTRVTLAFPAADTDSDREIGRLK